MSGKKALITARVVADPGPAMGLGKARTATATGPKSQQRSGPEVGRRGIPRSPAVSLSLVYVAVERNTYTGRGAYFSGLREAT